MLKVLAIAPHPDDEVFGCGGTLAKHARAGDEVHLCIVTRTYPPEWPEKEIEERRREVHRSADILGIKQVHFLDLPTVKLDTIPRKDLVGRFTQLLDAVEPEVVFIPHKGDVNLDHQAVFQAAMVAIRPQPGSTLKKVLSCETLSETEWGVPDPDSVFIPSLFVDISETLEVKLQAMAEYKLELKEFPHPRSLEAITTQAKLRGSTVGVAAAEAFMLIREIWT